MQTTHLSPEQTETQTQMDRRTARQTETQTDRQTDRQELKYYLPAYAGGNNVPKINSLACVCTLMKSTKHKFKFLLLLIKHNPN